MTSEANKTAAATMAAEASRQKRALLLAANPAGAAQGYDIGGEILGFYDHFIRELEKRDQAGSGRP